MQVTRATFIPLLAPANTDRMDPGVVREEYCGDLSVVYTFGPQFGRRVVTHADCEQMEMAPRVLRRAALEHLEVLASRAEFHGQPPALMLSFEGLESSLLLANDFWTRLEGAVPGELVVGVPARDVVVVTGSQSVPGLEKARRCVERIFFAGDENLLTRGLLVRRGGGWEPFDRSAPPAARPSRAPVGHHRGPDQPPRQYQEHVSWPGERVPVTPVRPLGDRMGPGPDRLAPAGPGARPLAAAGPMGVPGGPMGVPGGPPMAGPMTGPQPAVPRAAVTSLPPLTSTMPPGAMPPVPMGPASMGPASMGPASPAGPRGGLPPSIPAPSMSGPPMSAPPQQRRMSEYPRASDIAQQSAMPYSSVPYSAIPYSAMPNSSSPYGGVAPYSAIPYSATPAPQSPAAPHGGPPHSAYLQSRGAQPKPPYRDDMYSTQGHSRPLYRDPAPVSAVPQSAYPSGAYPQYHTGTQPQVPMSHREPERYEPEPSYPADQPQPTYPQSWGSAPDGMTRFEWRSGPRARFSR